MQLQQHKHNLVVQVLLWLQGAVFQLKQAAFQKIKRKMLRQDLRRMHKNNFQSITSSSDNNYNSRTLNGYVSISDFKPMDQNYSSVKIIDYQTYGVKAEVKSNLAKRIQYTSQQLFNKESFLQGWMKMDRIRQIFPEGYPLSDYAIKKIASYHQEALASVRRFTFTSFCKINLKIRRGFFSLTQSDPLKYKKTAISSSLTYLPERQNEQAQQAFQLLLRAGGDMQCRNNGLNQIGQLIQLMMKSNDSVRQEIFLQAIKQLSSKKEVYQRIMCCLCFAVSPSARQYIPLLNYFYEQMMMIDSMPKQFLNYCFYHLIKNFDRPRQHPPCLFELFCAQHCAKIPILVSFPKQKVFFIQSWTNVDQLLTQIVQYYSLDPEIQYLLQVNGFLMEKGCLFDNFNKYSKVDQQNYRWHDYIQWNGFRAVIVLKNVEDTLKSPYCHNIMYNYCAHQYLRGLYSLKSTDIVKIAALKMVSEMDCQQTYIFSYQNLVTKRKLRTIKSQQEKSNYKKHILKNYFKVRKMRPQNARAQIMQILSMSKGFNTHFFRSQIFVQDYDEFTAWVGLQKDRFIIVEPSSGRIMRNIPYSTIRQWGTSSSQLCLKLDDVGQFHIDCRQVDVLASVFETYLNATSKV